MECLNKIVDANVCKQVHVETHRNGEISATNLADVSISPKEQHGEERERVKEILLQNYGLTLYSCQRLDGFDDVNYLVTVIDRSHIRGSSSQYVLRIVNAQDSQEPGRIEAINEAMKHMHNKGIVTQIPVPNLHGQQMSVYTLDMEANSTSHVIVLRSFVPGTCMVSCALTPDDVFNCGVFVSRITQGFEDFHHPFFDTFNFSWSVDNRPYFRKMLPSIKDSSLRHLLEKIMDTVDEKLSRIQHRLKRGQIHGDIRPSNIIRPHQNDSQGPPGQDYTHQKTFASVTHWGLVDFHDTHRSYRVYELASSAARIMSSDQPLLLDRLDAPGHVLAGYQRATTLESSERDVLPYLILSDLCCMVAGCNYYLSLNPDNAEYLEKDIHNGVWALESLWQMTPSQAQARWEQVARSYDT